MPIVAGLSAYIFFQYKTSIETNLKNQDENNKIIRKDISSLNAHCNVIQSSLNKTTALNRYGKIKKEKFDRRRSKE
jgi:hypothetical protein